MPQCGASCRTPMLKDRVLFQILSTGQVKAELALYYAALGQMGVNAMITLGHS